MQCDTVYAVHDAGIDDSQFFSYNLPTNTLKALGELHQAYDIEGLAVQPTTHILYASSGTPEATLYTVDAQNGELSVVGAIGFDEVVSLAFHPDGSLWAWSKQGLLQIDVVSGQGTLVLAGNYAIQGLTWNKAGTTLYGVAEDLPAHSTLWAWTYDDDAWQVACEHLPKKVEGLETRPDGLFVYAFHNDAQLRIHTYEVSTCQTLSDNKIVTDFNDIEGIAWLDLPCDTSLPTHAEALQAYLESIGYSEVVIGTDGAVSAWLAGALHHAQLADTVTPGTPPADGQLVFTAIADSNGDGLEDFSITYPDGDQQILYYLGVQVQDVESHLRSLWEQMNDALVAGDREKAASFLTNSARGKYEPVFEALLPHMPEIVASYSPLVTVSISEHIGEFAVNRTIDGQLKVFLVYYLKGIDGTWRLDMM